MATVKPICRKDKINKSGKAPIKIRITENRKSREISIGQGVDPRHWDADSGRVMNTHPNSNRLNQLIASKESEYLDLAIDIDIGKKSIKQKSIREAVSNGAERCVHEYLDGIVESLEEENRFGYADDFRSAGKRLKKFQEFLNWQKLTFEDFTRIIQYKTLRNKLPFMDAFERFQREEMKLEDSSIYISSLRISRIFSLAIAARELDSSFNPMPYYTSPKPRCRKKFLTPDQLNAVISFPNIGGELGSVAKDMFLFCCLGGGLRFRDCIQLKWSNIIGGRMNISTQKTKTPVWFDLGKIPMKILEKYATQKKNTTQFVFPYLNDTDITPGTREWYTFISNCNYSVNRQLLNIANRLGFPHTMSFHTSRHTFATLAVRKGMKVTSLQRIMGHKRITTTQQYWHVLGADVEEDIQKFNDQISLGLSGAITQETSPIIAASSDLVQLFVLQMASVWKEKWGNSIEGVVVNPIDLKQYVEEANLPVGLRRSIIIRVILLGSNGGNEFGETLNRKSLFGDSVRFETVEMKRGQVESLMSEGNYLLFT